MWEEECESVRVLHRHGSECRETGKEDSDDDFVHVDSEGTSEAIPLLPSTSSKHPPEDDVKVVTMETKDNASTLMKSESLFFDSQPLPTRVVLSNWGVPFFHQLPVNLHIPEPAIYALLSAERPYYASKAHMLADKIAKAASVNSKAVPLKWERADFRVLYKLSSTRDYSDMAKQLKEGRLRALKVKGETYRIVTLEPVRVIDTSLKAVLLMSFPTSVSDQIKRALKPVLDPVAISRQFIFIPSHLHQQLTTVEDIDSPHLNPPSLLISIITSQIDDSTCRRVTQAFTNKEVWSNYDITIDQGKSPNVYDRDTIYRHKTHGTILPLFSLAVGQAGAVMENSIRVTILCKENFTTMVGFYKTVLSCDPVQSENHAVFSLMHQATSVLELVIYDTPTFNVQRLEFVNFNFFVFNLVSLIVELCRKFPGCKVTGGKGMCQVMDPNGNKITVYDRDILERVD